MTNVKSHKAKKLLLQAGIAVGIILFMGVLISAMRSKGSSNAMDLQVHVEGEAGKTFVTPRDVKETIQRKYGNLLAGTQMKAINFKEMEELLEEDAFVKEADVYVGAQNHIHVKIKQRYPVVRVFDKDKASFYLDNQGNFLPPSSNYTARVLVATGHIPTFEDDFKEKGGVIAGLFDLVQYIEQDAFLKPLVEQIYVDSKGDFSLSPKLGDHTITVGKAIDLKEKFDRLKVFYKEGMPYEGWRKYKTINLKYKGQVVCKKR